LATFDGDVLNALRDTDEALSTYAQELDHHTALVAATARAMDALKLADIQFTAGSTSFLDLLGAQSTAVAADQASAISEQSLVADHITVFEDLGGGWEAAPPVTYSRVP
jgi:outer membrane protein TolC